MSGVEHFHDIIIKTCDPTMLDTYTQASRAVQKVLYEATAPPTTDDPGLLALQLFLPKAIEQVEQFGPAEPTTKMAMLIGAIAFRTFGNDQDLDQIRKPSSFEDIWWGTNLHSLAAKCEETVGDVIPNTQGEFVNIDLKKMHEKFSRDLKDGKPEHIVITGLNATGKSKGINFLKGFLNSVGINTTIIKMPRPDGPASEVIMPVLKGEKRFKADASQMFFLGDALDTDLNPETLMLFDRHPRTEAYVYGPPAMERVVLSTQEIFDGIYWTFIMNRHPMAAKMTVANRETKPRIFERDIEMMAEQLIRFAKLTVLPGVRWITNDIPIKNGDPDWQVKISSDRLAITILSTGVLHRHMIKQGLARDFEEAHKILATKYVHYQTELYKAVKI